jgi:multidrug transporter EmrE-like cation transporter
MGNVFLLLTILSESFAVICMKLSAGFQVRSWTILAIISYGLSFIFLTLALKYLPAAIANAIWAGASTLLIAILSVLLFHEKLTTIQFISMLLIALGLFGLNIQKSGS